MKFRIVILIYFIFIFDNVRAQIQKGRNIELDYSMQSGFYHRLHQLNSVGTELVFGDFGLCKVFTYSGNDWKFVSKQIISPTSFMEFMQRSSDGKTVAALAKDTLKIFDINPNNQWIERPRIPEFIFTGNPPEIKLSPNGKYIAIHKKDFWGSTSFITIYSFDGSGWKVAFDNVYTAENYSHMQFDAESKNLLFTNEYRNYVIFIEDQNGVWLDRKLFFSNEYNVNRSYKMYSADTKKCIEILPDVCANRNVELVEYAVDKTSGIQEVRRQHLSLCSRGHPPAMSGDGNTLAFDNSDGLAFTWDTVWIFKRDEGGYFSPFGSVLVPPDPIYDFSNSMSLDYYGNTLSVLVLPPGNSGLKTYLQVFDLSKVSGTASIDSDSGRVRIFPNPTSGYIQCHDGWMIYGVSDITGKVIRQNLTRVDAMDIHDLPAGMYLVHVHKGFDMKVCKVIKM